MAHPHHDNLIDEQADDDRRRTQQDIVDEADDHAQAGIPAVLREVSPRKHADRRADQDPQQRHRAAAVDGIEQSPLAAGRRGHLGKYAPGQARHAVRYQGPEDRGQTGKSGQGGDQGQRQKYAVFDLSQQAPIHATAPERRSSLRSMACANAITVNVMRNSNSPRAIREEVYRSPTASVNSLAIAEDMVVPGASKEELIRCALPMTNVTAMVSPSARPRPNMIPPTMPTRECGTTTFQMTSQVVAPSP